MCPFPDRGAIASLPSRWLALSPSRIDGVALAEKLPQISGLELIAKLKKLGWEEHRRVNHGVAMIKKQGDRTLITVIPKKRENLPKGTLMAILSQTGLKKSDIN